MGNVQNVPKVRPVAGILAATPEILETASAELSNRFGPVKTATQPEPFTQTVYYQPEMGFGLLRQYLVFTSLEPAEELPDWKLWTNRMEQQLGVNPQGGRRVNIDPGYLAPGKLVLASTKDHSHRLYLREGIFAEVTLHVRNGRFQTWPWTYPDYATRLEFFDRAYQGYLQDLQAAGTP
jgi:hypothetical protein